MTFPRPPSKDSIERNDSSVSVTIMIIAFIAACFMKVNVIYVVLACGLTGVIRTLAGKRGNNDGLS